MRSSNGTGGAGERSEEVIVFPDREEMGREAAAAFARWASEAVRGGGRFAAALSGGATPRPLYRSLAGSPFREAIPWKGVHLFWGDERCVPPDHPDSNYRMAYETWISKVPIPLENVHRMRGKDDPKAAADEYEEQLRAFFGSAGWPAFDLILLGVGVDGHTASLFPGSSVLNQQRRWVAAPFVEKLKTHRLTLTLPVINNARRVLFLAAGEEKANIMKTILTTDPAEAPLPAQLIRPRHGRRLFFLDQFAAAWMNRKRGDDR